MGSCSDGRALYDLAGECGVGIGEACDRAGIARSTPPRWKVGTHARPAQVTRLRQAILAIARERGTLPAGQPGSEVCRETEPIANPSAAVLEAARESTRSHAKIMAKLQRLEDLLLASGLLALLLLDVWTA